MAISGQTKVDAAIKAINDFYAIGRASWDARPGRARYGGQQLEGEAEKQRLNPSTFQKARKFASEYSRGDLNALCQLIRKQTNLRTVFGRSHLVRLLDVPKPIRGVWQKKAIKKGWTHARLSAEIKVKLGRRRAGGIKPVISRDTRGIYQMLEDKCLAWRHLRHGLTEPMASMPNGIRASIDAVTEAMKKLEDRVSSTLQSKSPKRILASTREAADTTD